ncbi:MAG: PmbA protein [Planctomycetota bacterium]|jgi:PmbA protein
MSSQKLEAPPFDPAQEEARLLERCEQLVDLAVANGADEAEAFGSFSQASCISFEKGDLKMAQADDGTSIGLRVFKDGKQGFTSTNQTEANSLEETAQNACMLAGFSVADEMNKLPAARPLRKDTGSLVQPAVGEFGLEDVIECGTEFVERVIARDDRIAIDKADATASRISVAVHSTQGVHLAESDASVGLSIFGMAIDGDDVGGFDYWGGNVRDLSRLPALADETVTRFSDAVIGNLNAGPAETYTGPVLFSPAAFLSCFISPIISASSAIAVQRGRSALAGKIGELISNVPLSIVDDPTDLLLAGAGRFDREGQPTNCFSIVEAGELRAYIYNAYAARVDGCESTGHGAGGARSVPGLSTHAIKVGPGSLGDSKAMLAALDKGLFVQRFSGTVDPASGDFSGVAKSARWVENGQVVRSLKETLISGNAFELLQQVVGLSSTTEAIFGSAQVPFALLDGVSVTAG